MYRKRDLLVVGEIYHIFTRSIAEYRVFNNDDEFLRMKATIRYYQIEKPPEKFSRFIQSTSDQGNDFDSTINFDKEKLVQIIAYCLMPTHVHLVLKQLKENGISIFISNVLNSYTRYFNIKHKRKGPLWESRFKSVWVESDEQLLHLTRYVHLNPVTAYLANKPEEWLVSSYPEYISVVNEKDRVCKYNGILDIQPNSYREFVRDGVSYQRELAKIKKLLFE